MPQLAIVADDLTGAADSSACFAAAGYATVIPFTGPPYPAADVIALSTESRDLDAASAARLTGATISALAVDGQPPRWVYKKIDSVLRGHPRDELLAALAATNERRALVAPALPAEQRTTVGGWQRVHGVPLEESVFGGPGVSGDLSVILGNERALPVHVLALQTVRRGPNELAQCLAQLATGIVVADAETESDLHALAGAIAGSGLRVLCGTAGLARTLAAVLPLTAAVPLPVAPRRSGQPILVVAGSTHASTARQIAALERGGAAMVPLTQEQIDDRSCSMASATSAVTHHLAAGRTTVVTTIGLAPSAIGGRAVAARLAEIVSAPEMRAHLGGLVLTGGDVAAAVCTTLGASALWLRGEIAPGQPWGLLADGMLPGLPVATKAGSFGSDEALAASVGELMTVANAT